ncbi:flagellar biosynthetic protein FliR [Demequina aestuarii]|uniref:flagellar biosynthetic protein FliR n=1 Tax=Demequina aestuarii TaxID=327095 RepID=UPI0007851C64|nr:flagellar biosynthetic protein FliR [Demequina aestuarii]
MELSFELGFLETAILAGVRLAAFLVVSPPFHLSSFPGPVKVALALGIAVAAVPRVQGSSQFAAGTLLGGDAAQFIGTLVVQAVVGLALGFIVRLVFAAVQAAGGLIDLFGGFELAQGYDPVSGSQGAVFSRFYYMAALALLFASDAHQLVISGAVRSFDAVPLGAGINLESLATLMSTGLSQLMVSAVQIAGPLIVVLFLADVGLGLLTRVAPALNAFALGFPLKIFITLALGSVAFLALPQVIASLSSRAFSAMTGVTA